MLSQIWGTVLPPPPQPGSTPLSSVSSSRPKTKSCCSYLTADKRFHVFSPNFAPSCHTSSCSLGQRKRPSNWYPTSYLPRANTSPSSLHHQSAVIKIKPWWGHTKVCTLRAPPAINRNESRSLMCPTSRVSPGLTCLSAPPPVPPASGLTCPFAQSHIHNASAAPPLRRGPLLSPNSLCLTQSLTWEGPDISRALCYFTKTDPMKVENRMGNYPAAASITCPCPLNGTCSLKL